MIFKNFKTFHFPFSIFPFSFSILHFAFCIFRFALYAFCFSLFTFHFSLSLSYAEDEKTEIKQYKQLYNNGYVNWTDGIVVAKGIAPYPEKKDLASARALSKLAARKDCQRKLLATVLEINVDDEQKIENLIKTNKQLKINMEGVVKSAVVVEEKSDDIAQISSVIMQAPLWGISGVISVLLKNEGKMLKNKYGMEEIKKFDFEDFEGLVVDARDFKLEPALFPQIIDESGNIIYDENVPDLDALYKKGMIRYITTTNKDLEYLKGKKHFEKGHYNSQITKSVGRELRFPPSLAAYGNAALQCKNPAPQLCKRPFRVRSYLTGCLTMQFLTEHWIGGVFKPRIKSGTRKSHLSNWALSSVFSILKTYAEEVKKYFVKALKSAGKIRTNLILENRIALKVNKLKITDKYLRHCDVVVIVGSGVRGEKLLRDKAIVSSKK